MNYCWAGGILEIDLSAGNIERGETDRQMNEVYLGGRGTCTRLFWDRVPPEVSPLSDKNVLIFGTGVLTGTQAPASNRAVLVTRSPQTNLLTYSSMGGFWAPELKSAGYDTIVISGESAYPVYIYICNEKVEIRDASHLWGKDVKETQQIIRKELNNKKVQTLCIGQAGENKVYSASIEHSSGASFSRAGVGAIMGKKKLKAIAVYGKRDVYIARPEEFNGLCKDILRRADKIRNFFDNWPHNINLMKGIYANFSEISQVAEPQKLHAAFVQRLKARTLSCFNCQIRCKVSMSTPGGGYSFLKCQSWFPFMFATRIVDLEFNLECYYLCEKYGLDSISVANCIGFSIDLYQKGILSDKDTGGLQLEWGNRKLALRLIQMIAFRQGLGDVLANGVNEAAREIGKGAQEHAYHVKKLEMILYTPYPYTALCAAISDRCDPTRVESALPQNFIRRTREFKQEYVESGFLHYPKELEKAFLDDTDMSGKDFTRNAQFCSYDQDRYNLADCTGLCAFATGFWPYNPIQNIDHINLISHGAGIDFGENEGMILSKRVGTLTRAYNVMLGIRRKDDKIPEKFFKWTPPTPYQKLDRELFNSGVEAYYKLRGWNKEGVPSEQTLNELSLEFVRKELERRGILSNDKDNDDQS